MRIVIDESVYYTPVKDLKDAGYDVLSISDDFPSIQDNEIILFSFDPPSIILTEDKDFGELVYKNKLSVTCIILLRYEIFQFTSIRQKLILFLNEHLNNLTNTFTLITSNKTRIRPIQ